MGFCNAFVALVAARMNDDQSEAVPSIACSFRGSRIGVRADEPYENLHLHTYVDSPPTLGGAVPTHLDQRGEENIHNRDIMDGGAGLSPLFGWFLVLDSNPCAGPSSVLGSSPCWDYSCDGINPCIGILRTGLCSVLGLVVLGPAASGCLL